MVQLQKLNPKFEAAGLQLIGLSYDSVDILAKFTQAKKITFPLVSDEGSATIKKLQLEYKKGLPYPGTFVIGTDGKVLSKLFLDDFKKRHTADEILAEATRASMTAQSTDEEEATLRLKEPSLAE